VKYQLQTNATHNFIDAFAEAALANRIKILHVLLADTSVVDHDMNYGFAVAADNNRHAILMIF
jgi:hypothetical protein